MLNTQGFPPDPKIPFLLSDMEKRQGKVTSPAGGVGGAGIGSRKGRGPTPVGRTGAVQLYPPGAHTHNY